MKNPRRVQPVSGKDIKDIINEKDIINGKDIKDVINGKDNIKDIINGPVFSYA